MAEFEFSDANGEVFTKLPGTVNGCANSLSNLCRDECEWDGELGRLTQYAFKASVVLNGIYLCFPNKAGLSTLYFDCIPYYHLFVARLSTVSNSPGKYINE